MTEDERRLKIWSTNAWVGMNTELSPGARAAIFRLALEDVLPDATDSEVGFALGLLR